MQNNEIKITYSCEETLKKMKEYMADAKSVTLYTSSFNYFTSRNTMMVNIILNLIADFSRQDGKDASIVTDFYIDKESFTDSDLGRAREFEYRGIPVKVVHKKSAIDKFFINLKEKIEPIRNKKNDEYVIEAAQDEKERNLLRKLGENEEPTKITGKAPLSFYDMFDLAVTYYDDCKDIIRDCLNTLKQDLLSDARSLISSEGLDGAKFERSIEECFDELDKNLSKLNNDSGQFLIKQVVLFILSLADLSGEKGIGKMLASAGSGLYEFIKLNLKLYEYETTRALYGVSLPILNFFASRFASIINTINVNSSCNVLVFKKDKDDRAGYFIDITHLDFGYRFFTDPNNLNEMNYNTDEGCSIYGYLDDARVFDYTKEQINYNVVNKNLGFGSGDDTLFDKLKKEIKGLNANLNFICATNFNSVKLANLISDKSDKNGKSTNDEMNSKDFSNLNKNYIVLSNSPFRSNAGLREEVISKSLDQEIKDELNRSNKSNLVKQKFTDIKTLEPVKDYSKYSIDINKGNNKSTLVLNLSPFARVSKSYIDNIKEKVEEYKELDDSKNTEYLSNHVKYEEILEVNVAHINAYAKQPNDMEEIKKNEETYMKKAIATFRVVFNKVNHGSEQRKFIKKYNDELELNQLKHQISNAKISDENISSLQEEIREKTALDHPYNYSLIEVLSLAVAYFIITKSFSGNLVKQSSKYDGEYIEISEENIRALHLGSSVKLGDKSLKLFFYKDTAKNSGLKSGEYLCIEDIVKYMDKAKVDKITSIEELLTENDGIEEEVEIKKESTSNDKNAKKNENIDPEQIKFIEELLDKQEKEIKANWNKDNAVLKDALKGQNRTYDDSRNLDKEVTSLIVKTAIEGVFPLAEFVSEDGVTKVFESLSSFIFSPNKKELKNEFLDEIGILNIVRQMFTTKNIKNVDNFLKQATNLKSRVKVLRKSKHNLIVQAINATKIRIIIGYYNLNIIWSKFKSLLSMNSTFVFSKLNVETLENILKDYGKSLGKDMGIALFTGVVELWKTSYDQLEENYKEIMHTRYKYNFNEAFALNNISYKPMSLYEAYNKDSTNTYCYYPVMIYQNYISLNLNRLFLGANISSGGLDYNSFIYYDIDHKKNKLSFNLASKLALNNLSTYLCLDELRGAGNEIDARYFKYARSKYAISDVDINLLDTDVEEEKEVYEIYKQSSLANVASGKPKYPIDSYQKAAVIINKLKRGIFNTEDNDNSHSNLSRDLVEALDTIGNNNIKGIYVGCKIEHGKRTKENIPPRLIGRLATTIVMEDGLYIG